MSSRTSRHRQLVPLTLLLAALVGLWPHAASGRGGRRAKSPAKPLVETAVPLRVIDGDTLEVNAFGRTAKVRLLGLDCPESHINVKCQRDEREGRAGCEQQVPRGQAAAARTAEWVQVTQQSSVQLIFPKGKRTQDRYGRFLAYVQLSDGRDLGLELIRSGLCDDYSWRFDHPRRAAYADAQATAARSSTQ